MSGVNKLRQWPTWPDLVAGAHAREQKDPYKKQDALDRECRRIAAGRPYAVRNRPGGYDVTSENGDIVYGMVRV